MVHNHLVDQRRTRGRKRFTRQETNTRILSDARQTIDGALGRSEVASYIKSRIVRGRVAPAESCRFLPQTSDLRRLSPA